MYREKFAKRLNELCDENSLNIISKKIGVSNSTLYRYANCKMEIGLETLCKLADYFDVPLDYLVGRKEY